MKYMQKLAAGQDTIMAYNAVMRQGSWGDAPLALRSRKGGSIVNWFQFDLFPQLRPFVFGIMARIEGEQLGQVALVRLAPGQGKVLERSELAGAHHYLVPLNVAPGMLMAAGDDPQVMLNPGDVWWAHGGTAVVLENNSAEELLLLVVEAVPNAPATEVPEGQE